MGQDANPSPKPRYFGWWIVSISGVLNAITGGLFHTGMSVYFLPLIRDFGVSHTKLSFAFSLASLEAGVQGPVAGFAVDRFGPRIVIIVGLVMSGVGFMLLATTQSYPIFLVVFLGLVAIGVSTPFNGIAKAINQWFRRRLGIAMSLTQSGSAIGGFLLTPAVAWVVLEYGWRWAAFISGLVLLVVGVSLALQIRRPRGDEAAVDDPSPSTSQGVGGGPESLDREPNDPSDTGVTNLQEEFTLGEALRTRVYWLIALAIGLRLAAQSALMVHMVPMLVSRDVGEGTAAIMVAMTSLVRLPSSIGAGLLADRWSRPRVAALSMLAGALTTAVALWGPSGVTTGIMFAFLFGISVSSNSITWVLVGQFFGRRDFGKLLGGVSLVQTVMSTGGPIAAGMVFDSTEEYTLAFVGVGIVFLVSAVLFWNLKTPVRRESPMSRAR